MTNLKFTDCDVLKIGPAPDCDFSSITAAAATLMHNNAPVILQIMPGRYLGSVVFQCSNIIIEGLGESSEDVVISDGHYARQLHNDGTPIGTFETAVFRTDGNNITLRNITIVNTAGEGSKVGQAVALYTDGNGILVEKCRLIGHQDTLFTAPFPLLNKNGVNEGFGPKGNLPRTPSTCIFKDCYIEGDVDFIFGGATALFDNCRIHSHNHGYVAAPSTVEELEFGYLFNNCSLTSDTTEPCVYLARPWRPYGKAVFIGCSFGSHIFPELFDDWDNINNRETSYFAVEEDTVATENCAFGVILSHEKAKQYHKNFTDYLSKYFAKY